MALPFRTVTLPSVLSGQVNGKLAPSILVDTAVPGADWPCRLVLPAARSYRALCAAAKTAGHILKPSGRYDSYRPYDVQERIFRERFRTYNTDSGVTRQWLGHTWWLVPGMALAAVPGTSNHGLGLAVDDGEETDGDSGTERIDAATLAWLVANEERFGFSHEVQSEPWHIHYFAGDAIPAAVLAFERTTASHPTDPEDDDMAAAVFYFKGDDGHSHAYHVVGNVGKYLPNKAAIDTVKFFGVKEANKASDPARENVSDTVALLDGPCRNVA